MKVKITEAELISLIEKVIKENRLNEGKKKKKGKKDKKWIQKAYASGDVKEDKLTDYCDGKVTCACVERALKSKGMKKGAQMYLNMNKSKCKSLKESIVTEEGQYGNPDEDIYVNFKNQMQTKEINRDAIVNILKEIYTLQQEDAPAIAQRRLEELFGKVGISGERNPIGYE